QQVALRVADPERFHTITVVANAEHRFVVAEQLRQVGAANARIVLEPVSRNTAPAIIAGVLAATRCDEDALVLVMPADHDIPDVAAFRASVALGAKVAEGGALVLFGIDPTGPETGYGYICAGEALPAGGRRVAAFVEKPDVTRATSFLAAGDHYWNSGIFLLPASLLLAEMNRCEPAIVTAMEAAIAGAGADIDFLRLDPVAFAASPSISLDHAVMERTSRAAVVPATFRWSDVGAWSSLWRAGRQDEDGNVALGDTLIEQTRRTYVRSDGPLVATLGVEDLIVVATDDAVLVAHRDAEQSVKKVVERLRLLPHSAATQTARVYRPWGWYESVHSGEHFQVKHLTVKPGARLSLQKHQHRAEHWVVVGGHGEITVDTHRTLLGVNESVFVPRGATHRLSNPGAAPLHVIEVQIGAYLGEDDIVRFEDDYARIADLTSAPAPHRHVDVTGPTLELTPAQPPAPAPPEPAGYRLAQRVWKALPLPLGVREQATNLLYRTFPLAQQVAVHDRVGEAAQTLSPRPSSDILAGPFILSGFLGDVSGIGRGGRMSRDALRAAGIAPILHDMRKDPFGWTPAASGGVWFGHCNAPQATEFLARTAAAHACYRISYWAWELPNLPQSWAEGAGLYHEIWAPSTFVANAIQRATQGMHVQVRCVPHPLPDVSGASADRRRFDLPDDAFVFLCMFDVLSSATRKNPRGAIDAFKLAFAPHRSDVWLCIKVVCDLDDPPILSALRMEIEGWPNIRIVTERLSDLLSDRLIASADCFVSLHRSEGFGLSIAQAMAMGKPVIVTGWSGNMDFCDAHAVCIDYQLRPVIDPTGIYAENDQVWAEPSLEHAAQAMQAMADDPDAARQRGLDGKLHIASRLPRLYPVAHLRSWLAPSARRQG
ncbi:mannose-1-phosphate guanylyltransferase/mannose-6-phosphate isomerase, partial [uncultured Phenylobacterium sp.]|uniref:mannose-1-phosphate guanylyltransferase/mannose-6-phosphate isomerase n=1 Tax=uncultured Phenylobacterium sp. TaxID=349273 RepID=UPI0026005AA4